MRLRIQYNFIILTCCSVNDIYGSPKSSENSALVWYRRCVKQYCMRSRAPNVLKRLLRQVQICL